ncbi:MAG: spermidine synthase [Terriglobales bacterium]
MDHDSTSVSIPGSPARVRWELFFISFLILFLELALIRWLPAHVLYLTFFTNMVLLACFLGMSVGCLTASRPSPLLLWTPLWLLLAVAAAHAVESLQSSIAGVVDVGNQASPQLVFFGTEYRVQDLARFVIPVEALGGFFFLVVALALVGPGQQLGRCVNRVPGRVQAYTLNIAGSVAGIVFFSLASWLELSPIWWFLPVAAGLGYFLRPYCQPRPLMVRWALLLTLALAANVRSGPQSLRGAADLEIFWSPYYRVDYWHDTRTILVNLIGHQAMSPRESPQAFAYSLPYLLQRDSGGPPFEEVLIIGAGSGNDVSRALEWGARHVDAVEIDPVLQRLGARDHPDRPYQDSRVRVHYDDGRNFLRVADRQYDLIIYALVDSLVLHSSYSNIRLESYLFTDQAFADVRRRLKPGGVFAMYNYFRRGWIVARLATGVERAFGGAPLVLPLPYAATVDADSSGGFTLLLAGGSGPVRRAFQQHPEYWLSSSRSPGPASPNGFASVPLPGGEGMRLGLATVVPPPELGAATDEWPFLYLRRPMVPGVSLRGAMIMAGLSLLVFFLFLPRAGPAAWARYLDGRMFFLGAGFMLIETKAVVQMALLFGSTWMVNSVVFFSVLVMILVANLFVLRVRPAQLGPFYLALLAALALNILVPLDRFLGMPRTLQVAASSVLVFAPILFAGVVFAVSFARTSEPDLAFGANIAGAMLGGLAEYTSMLLGFRYLVVVAMVFYALSAVFGRRSAAAAQSSAAEVAHPAFQEGTH